MRLGEVVDPIEEFVRRLSEQDYGGAAELVDDIDPEEFRDGLSVWEDLLPYIAPMPPDGWRWIQVVAGTAGGEICCASVFLWDKRGDAMSWGLDFELISGHGETWRILNVYPRH